MVNGREGQYEEVLWEITNLLADLTGTPRRKLRPDATLESGLGITGDDAAELIEEIAKRFHISFEGFRFLDHFGPEGFDIFTPIMIFCLRRISPDFRRRWREAEARECDITVRHLVDCVIAGRWVAPSPKTSRPHRRSVFERLFRLPLILFGLLLVGGAFTFIVAGIWGAFHIPGDWNKVKLVAIAAMGAAFLAALARQARMYIRAKLDEDS